MNMQSLISQFEAIHDRYDANYDIAPGPRVTHTDMMLLQSIKTLARMVNELSITVQKQENEIKKLKVQTEI